MDISQWVWDDGHTTIYITALSQLHPVNEINHFVCNAKKTFTLTVTYCETKKCTCHLTTKIVQTFPVCSNLGMQM